MSESRDWIDLLERRERAAEAREALFVEQPGPSEGPDLGRAIAQARKDAGLSWEDLAERVGVSEKTLRRLEGAKREGHSLRLLQRIAEALQLHLDVGFKPRH